MYILGLNAYHWDSSACILKDGELIAASEEERFNRVKHWSGLPVESIRFCLGEIGIDIREVDYIATGHDPKAKLTQKIIYGITNRLSADVIKRRLKRSKDVTDVLSEIARSFGYTKSDLRARFFGIEHHRSHLASAFFASPFETAALLSLDAFGDFTSTMRGVGEKNKIKILDSVSYPHSLGMFYTALTQFLGFEDVGDEYKVMGLAPYGNPQYVSELKKMIHLEKNGLFTLNKKYFSYFRDGVILEMRNNRPFISTIYNSAISEIFGAPRSKEDPLTQFHKDLAASVQKLTEEIIFHIASDLRKKTKLPFLCIAGGIAQNSVANGKIAAACGFEKLYIPSAGHDAGISMGSALYVYNHELGRPRSAPIWSAYTGSKFSNEQIEKYLSSRNIVFNKLDDESLYEKVTDKLINAGVIGWFNGRAEFGPRALGARSIIVDPRRTDAKELLNSKIKRRESFRPFAPSILKEYVGEYFEVVDEVPFMEKVYPIRKDKHQVIPAVTHADGTGRLQTVDKEVSPRYYRLIDTFRRKTGVPVLLNTSFNENEPIVNSPEHALDCFLRTSMDMLVLENCVVERQ
jgi:carbamoyltransferase